MKWRAHFRKSDKWPFIMSNISAETIKALEGSGAGLGRVFQKADVACSKSLGPGVLEN